MGGGGRLTSLVGIAMTFELGKAFSCIQPWGSNSNRRPMWRLPAPPSGMTAVYGTSQRVPDRSLVDGTGHWLVTRGKRKHTNQSNLEKRNIGRRREREETTKAPPPLGQWHCVSAGIRCIPGNSPQDMSNRRTKKLLVFLSKPPNFLNALWGVITFLNHCNNFVGYWPEKSAAIRQQWGIRMKTPLMVAPLIRNNYI